MTDRSKTAVYRIEEDPCDTVREMYRLTAADGSLFVRHSGCLMDELCGYRMTWTKADCDAVCREYIDLREKLGQIALCYADFEAGNLTGKPAELVAVWNSFAKPLSIDFSGMDLDDIGAILMSADEVLENEGIRRLGEKVGTGLLLDSAIGLCKGLAHGGAEAFVRTKEHELAQALAVVRFARERFSHDWVD